MERQEPMWETLLTPNNIKIVSVIAGTIALIGGILLVQSATELESDTKQDYTRQFKKNNTDEILAIIEILTEYLTKFQKEGLLSELSMAKLSIELKSIAHIKEIEIPKELGEDNPHFIKTTVSFPTGKTEDIMVVYEDGTIYTESTYKQL